MGFDWLLNDDPNFQKVFCCSTMALCFGEIIEPCSRAIYEDDEEKEEICTLRSRLVWRDDDFKARNPSLVFDVMFVFHGRLPLAFAKSYIIDTSSPIAEIYLCEENIDASTCRRHDSVFQHPTKVFANGTVGFCLISTSLTNDVGYTLMESLGPILEKCKRIVTFMTSLFCHLKMEYTYELPIAMMKELKTSHDKSEYLFHKLVAPNFVEGLPAAVISWCEINQKDATLFICYCDEEHLDSDTSAPFRKVFQDLGYSYLKKMNEPYNRNWFCDSSSSLYT